MKKLLLALALLVPISAAAQTLVPTGGGSSTPCTTTALSLQYNAAGAFGCVSGWTTNGSTTLTGGAGTTLTIGAATIGSNALAVAGTSIFSNTISIGGISTGIQSNHLLLYGANPSSGGAPVQTGRLEVKYPGTATSIVVLGAGSAGAPNLRMQVDSVTGHWGVNLGATPNSGFTFQRDVINGEPIAQVRSTTFEQTLAGPTTSISAGLDKQVMLVSAASLSGSNAISMFDNTMTANTSGVYSFFKLALTNTASGANSKFINFLGGAGGATPKFSVDIASGNVISAGVISAALNQGIGLDGTISYSDGIYAGAGPDHSIHFQINGSDYVGLFYNSNAPQFQLRGAAVLAFSSNLVTPGSTDTALSRDGPGIIDVGTGAQGSKAGSLNLTNLTGTGTIVIGTADATTATGGALQVTGGASVAKRFWIPAITASAGLQTAVLCQSSGGEMIADSVACLASGSQFKTILGPMEDGALGKLMKLPMDRWAYKAEGNFKSDDWTRERIGPIAQDVAAMDNRLAGYDSDGNIRTFSTEQLLAFTIKAVQELNAKVDARQ